LIGLVLNYRAKLGSPKKIVSADSVHSIGKNGTMALCHAEHSTARDAKLYLITLFLKWITMPRIHVWSACTEPNRGPFAEIPDRMGLKWSENAPTVWPISEAGPGLQGMANSCLRMGRAARAYAI